MFPLFGRRPAVHLEMVTPPVELSAEDRYRLADIDRRLTALALMGSMRSRGRCDVLLDRRLAIQPAQQPDPPVIPGRAS